jgi:CheY-like chemotaxis protein
MSKKIIFVEDDLMVTDIFTSVFKQSELDVQVITSGHDAIKKIKQIQEDPNEKPGLFLVDLILPDINGIEVLKEAKGNDITKDIPFFILSNYSDPELQKEGTLKPDKFILKISTTPMQLVELIKDELKILT